ncbi:MAG: hypothetical protein K0M50_02890 [Prolixibacteraceae bacterium]|nr:hypothetical protein [Prolixibacteraceae bacterium]
MNQRTFSEPENSIEEKQSKFKEYAQRNPKVTFYVMIGIMAVSIIISISYNSYQSKHREKAGRKSLPAFSVPIDDGINSASSLFEVLNLKKEINELLSKQTLTQEDSLNLLQALKKLESLNKSIIKKPEK